MMDGNTSNESTAGKTSSFKDAMGAWGARDAKADGKNFLNTGRRSSTGIKSPGTPSGSTFKKRVVNRRGSADDVQLSPTTKSLVKGRTTSTTSTASRSSSNGSTNPAIDDPRSSGGIVGSGRAVSTSVLPDGDSGTMPLASDEYEEDFDPKSPSRTRKKSSSFTQRMNVFGGDSPKASYPMKASPRIRPGSIGSLPLADDNDDDEPIVTKSPTRTRRKSASFTQVMKQFGEDNNNESSPNTESPLSQRTKAKRQSSIQKMTETIGQLDLTTSFDAVAPPPPPEDSPSTVGSPTPTNSNSNNRRSSSSSKGIGVPFTLSDDEEELNSSESGSGPQTPQQKRRSSLANRISMFNSSSTLPDIARIGTEFVSPRLLKIKKTVQPSPRLSSSGGSFKKKSPEKSNFEIDTTTKKVVKEKISAPTPPPTPQLAEDGKKDPSAEEDSTTKRRGSVGNLISKFKAVNDTNASANVGLRQRKVQTQTDHKLFQKRAAAQKQAVKEQKPKKKNMEIVCATKFAEDDLQTFKPPTFEKTKEQFDIIKEALAKNFVFDDLLKNEKELKTFVDAFEEITYSCGTEIITQGDKGDYFYIIESGAVNFLVNGVKVGTAYEGKSFGELALLYTAPRAATVTAASKRNGNTQLFRVDQKSFRFILQNQLQESETEKRDLLKRIPFAKELTFQQITRLTEVMTPRMFQPDEVVVKKGDAGDAFYVLAEGSMKVTDISVGNVSYEDVELVSLGELGSFCMHHILTFLPFSMHRCYPKYSPRVITLVNEH